MEDKSINDPIEETKAIFDVENNTPDDTSYEMLVAKSSPKKVQRVKEFRRKTIHFQLASITCLLVIILSIPYTINLSIWSFLSVAAILLGIKGIYTAYNEIRKLEVEDALVIKIKQMGKKYLKSGDRYELTELRKIAPTNDESLSPIRLIDRVANDAMMSKFDSGTNLIMPYQDESYEVIFKLQNYQKIALWIGIAGTFIGIINAINPETIKGLENEFLKTITTMFDSLAISFSASLAGLISAILIGWFILIIRNKQEKYFKNMENVVSVILKSARKSKNKDKYLSEFESLRDELDGNRGLTLDLQKAILRMQRSINNLQQNIASQNGQIQQSVNKFYESNQRLNGIVRETEEELKATHNSIALKATLQESISNTGTQMSATISKQMALLSGEIKNFRLSAESLEKSVKHHSIQTQSFSQTITTELSQLRSKIHNFKVLQIGFFGFLDRLINGKR